MPLGNTAKLTKQAAVRRSLEMYSNSATFFYDYVFTGSVQNFIVPVGVTQIAVQAYGAKGGDGGYAGGYGGYVAATLSVNPGQSLYIYVGGAGSSGYYSPPGSFAHPSGGYNGGGYGSANSCYSVDRKGGGGGGATDIRTNPGDLSSRIIVAGGGGGGGCSGYGMTGGGSSPSDGGLGGGTVGVGGDADYYGSGAGGGGGGYIGGGGGYYDKPGGGGSSYVVGETLVGYSYWTGDGSDGYLSMTFSTSAPTAMPSMVPTSLPSSAPSSTPTNVPSSVQTYLRRLNHQLQRACLHRLHH